MPDLFAAPNALENLRFFIYVVRRDEHGNRLTNGFLCCVAKHFLGGPVPTRNDSVQILADDRVIRRVHNRRQESAVSVVF
jgi:hypothetical protein